MEVKVSLDIQQLIQIARQLPKEQKSQLMAALRKDDETEQDRQRRERSFLLQNPVFDKEQLDEIARARKVSTNLKRRMEGV